MNVYLFTYFLNLDDSTCDLPLNPNNTQQYIVWGIGGLGETAFKHFSRAEGKLLDYGIR